MTAEQILMAGYLPLTGVVALLFWELRKSEQKRIDFAEGQLEKRDQRDEQWNAMLRGVVSLADTLTQAIAKLRGPVR